MNNSLIDSGKKAGRIAEKVEEYGARLRCLITNVGRLEIRIFRDYKKQNEWVNTDTERDHLVGCLRVFYTNEIKRLEEELDKIVVKELE